MRKRSAQAIKNQMDLFSVLFDQVEEMSMQSEPIVIAPNVENIVPFPVKETTQKVLKVFLNEKKLNTRNYVINKLEFSSNQSKKALDNINAIKLLKEIEAGASVADKSQKDVLVKYTGWGGLPAVFDLTDTCKMPDERDALKLLLNDSEYNQAKSSVLNAHYTPESVIKFMWDSVQKMGFNGGKVLDPSTGIGHFIGCMPTELAEKSQIHAVEIDDVSSRLAKLLYPDVLLNHCGLENTKFKSNSFDLVISNIPFGDYRVSDPVYDEMKLSIHNYFFAKSLDLVKAGGLVAFVTSRHTLDSAGKSFREYLAERAELVAAFRLPSCTFKLIANTDVVADVIFLRKRHLGEVILESEREWVDAPAVGYSKVSTSKWFVNKPECILGEMTVEGNYYQKQVVVKLNEFESLEGKLIDALEMVPSGIYSVKQKSDLSNTVEEFKIPSPKDVKEGAYTVVAGNLMINEGGSLRLVENEINVTAVKRIKGMIEIRNQLRVVIAKDMNGENSDDARKELNAVYDAFVKKMGNLWDRANRLAFKNDPDLPMLLALEDYDEENDVCLKSKIFSEVTITRSKLVDDFDSLEAGILVSLNKFANINHVYIANRLQIEVEEVEKQLHGLDYVFVNPDNNQFEMKDSYLSGNVRQKLAEARIAADTSEMYVKNVKALEEVQPVQLSHEDINVRLGAPWIPVDIIKKFVSVILECDEDNITVSNSSSIGSWAVNAETYWIKNSVNNTSIYGTQRISAVALVEDGLNQRTPTVYDRVEVDDGKFKQVVNPTETEAARDRLQKIKEKFTEWLWSDQVRRDKLVTKYNELYNSIVVRKYDGAHLQLPGINNAVTLRPHQKNAIWRGLVSEFNLLLAHCVGAGKTMAYCAIAMEGKRIGLFNKPMMAVPNHMLEQFSSEFLKLYPAANILVASKDDLSGDKRKILLSRIATGNWDAVVITHSSFEKLPLSSDYIESYESEIISEMEIAIREQKSIGGTSSTRLVKTIEGMKKRALMKFESMKSNQDDCLKFEELGVDQLFVDEAHLFKNLLFFTKMNRVSGLPSSFSKRAFDMLLKTRYISESRSDNRGVVFGTATPISNTIAEMYVVQHYLQNRKLEELGIGMFDSWASNFGETVTSIEVAPDGSGYRMHTRFCRFTNVPELMSIFKMVADVQTKAMLKLPVPEIDGGKHTVVVSKPSPELKEYVNSLVERAELIREGGVDPRDDNMLCVTNDGRKAALDMRLINPNVAKDPDCKVTKCVENVYKEWLNGMDRKLTQLVFCDLSTPNAVAFSVYKQVKEDLVAKGIPESEIAFIHDFDSDAAKAKLFKSVRIGVTRVLLGSTSKLGFGTNVQDLLVAEHHLDAPWRPSDVEQRDGRIERQGNTNEKIRIYRYVTEESFDAYMWQTLETKMRFINQVMTGEVTARNIEDVEMSALSYAEVKAIASGNPMIIEKAGVDAEVAKLTMLRQNYLRGQQSLKFDLKQNQFNQDRTKDRALKIEMDLKQFSEVTSDSDFIIKLYGKSYADKKVAGEVLIATCNQLSKEKFDREVIGSFKGLSIVAQSSYMGVDVFLEGNASYKCNLFITAEGSIQVIINTYNKLPKQLEVCSDALNELSKNQVKLVSEIGKPFEYEERYKNRLERQMEIDKLLGIHKDIEGISQLSDLDENLAVAA